MSPAVTSRLPAPGEIIRVRARTWLVESLAGSPTVRAACLDDDAQGQPLEIVWELERDAEILDESVWKTIGQRGFDPPRQFSAYVKTLRWNCVTATRANLFQAPFRAGIRIDAYQLEPLRKALLLPRVNLFIADDVGLGKTIEAGLIASELLLRRRVREIVVACPPSMLTQWRDELEARFGLTFEILDRDYIERVRQERGYGVNPWTTFPRFLVSQRLLIDEAYAAPLRDWLDNFRPGALLILDEAHHAAPSSGAKFAIDTRITRAVRDIAPRFEHRLFLSATPHNGHSNSFSSLLNILDDKRFAPGVKVGKGTLNDVMIRRLKEDVREVAGGFPKRKVSQIDLKNLPDNAPELELSRLLDQYRQAREKRVEDATKKKQAEAALLISGLQQRLLSSVEAFARTLKVHRRTMEKIWAREIPAGRGESSTRMNSRRMALLAGTVDGDDDLATVSEEDFASIEEGQIEESTRATAGDEAKADSKTEKDLLDKMAAIAEQARSQPDARVLHLLEWIRVNQCAGIRVPGEKSPKPGATWKPTRVLIFTEYEDTKRYLVNMLRDAVAETDQAEHRIEVFHGPTPPKKRDQIKRAFNAPPDEHPVRILVATDAAREGLNLQAHCHHLFHFDVPWNPSRLEQRNGRIDRKLQPAPEVFCHYFVYAQRPEDRVLQALVRKTRTIREELGSLAEVLESRLESTLKGGISHNRIAEITAAIDGTALNKEDREATEEELEAVRERQDSLREQVATLSRRVEDARKWIGLDAESLRDAISCSLELQGGQPLSSAATPKGEPPRFTFPNLETRQGGDPTWAVTLDTLRVPPKEDENGTIERNFQWRKNAPLRPVVFDAPSGIDDHVVQLHLNHRVVQRLLGRFLAQGFIHNDLSRACLAQSEDNIPRVVLLGRLSLYGPGAVRLHEEILSVTARWSPQADRKGPLSPYARDAEARTMELLESALKPSTRKEATEQVRSELLATIGRDIEELLPHLQERGQGARGDAEKALTDRGQAEANAMREILEQQKKRILAELKKSAPPTPTLELTDEMKRHYEEARRQYESNRRYWESWIANVDGDLEREPARVLNFYRINSFRIEPVGLVYLYPVKA